MAYGLEFMGLPKRGGKPRARGITIARDWGFSRRQAEDVAESLGEYLDYMKIRQWAIWYQDEALTRDKCAIYRAAGIKPIPGGIVFEVGYTLGQLADTYRGLLDLGFQALEISDNILEFSPDEMQRVVAEGAASGLEVIFEYGKKYPTEAFDVQSTAAEIRGILEAGATKVILERSQLDITLGPRCDGVEGKRILELAEAVGVENLIFEAETSEHQMWLIKTFGPEVNLGPNITPDQVALKVEPARYGLGREEGYSIFERLTPAAPAAGG